MQDLMRTISQAGAATDIVLQSGAKAVSRLELLLAVEGLAKQLRILNVKSVALYADNGIDWILTDFACRVLGIRIVPVPLFFSAAQIKHTISSSGATALISDQQNVENLICATVGQPFCGMTSLYTLEASEPVALPEGTQKITFTSGTTGSPKGVCLSAEQQAAVATAIAAAASKDNPKHLCVLPLSTLLENLAGVYAPLLSGGSVNAPSLADVGLAGSSGLDIKQFLHCITEHQPNTMILVPEMLNALTEATECGWRPPSSLHFVAVGGGKVSPELLRRARAAGLPAYEGYGLSECASVVTLNVPGADHIGSVGQPLPHVSVQIEQGEIVVRGSEFLGYAGQPDSWNAAPLRTGDLGHIDDDGFVFVSGRAKNQLISSFGRNISPEWVESELLAGSLLQQVVVIGDARPYCVALVEPRNAATTDADIDAWMRSANQKLPDYARVVDWHRVTAPQRATIESDYSVEIEEMYATKAEASNQ
ncbi:MAG: AMP-binding protein [Woeseiaceae bacterium]|nr:AMP-binding protein [Woeseiaceae bacterium]MDX2608304.1 AMP-binding protein [Woeseiaceae bacterium]